MGSYGVGLRAAAGDKPQPYVGCGRLGTAGSYGVGLRAAAGDKPQPYVGCGGFGRQECGGSGPPAPTAAGDEFRHYVCCGVECGKWFCLVVGEDGLSFAWPHPPAGGGLRADGCG